MFGMFQVVAGKMMEQGPVVVISFQAQQIQCVQNMQGQVVEGDPVSTEVLSTCIH